MNVIQLKLWLTTLSKMIRLRKEDYGGVLIDKEQISFIEILTKHITNINIKLSRSHWLPLDPTHDIITDIL